MTNRKNKPVELLDQPFEHWHVLGPILWWSVVYSAAGILHLLGQTVPPLYVALSGAVTMLFGPLVAVFKRFTFFLMASMTGLLTWTTATTPWSRWPVMSSLVATLAFGMGYRVLRTREEKQADQEKEAEQAAKKGKYLTLLEKIGIAGLKESGRTPFGAGKTIHLLLPVNGKVTLQRLKDSTEALEIAAARAGITATFEFERGSSAAEVLLHVFDTDVLAETFPLEFERKPKSIHEPIPLGKFPTGEVCMVTFREVAALMVGLRGRGKSGLINTHLAHLTGCTDAVVWMLDGKGGETVRPWLQPFLDMVTDRPVIDWAGYEESEFDAILLATRAVVKYRTSADFKAAGLGPSASAPAVILIVEEASVITGVGRYGGGNRQQLAQDATTLGRSSYLELMLATQRATLDMVGSGSMKSNLNLRYGMGIQEAQDARMIFPDAQMARALFRLATDDRYRGTFLMQGMGKSRIMPAKGFFVDPVTIPGIAETNTRWVGQLDQGTADYVHQYLVSAGVPGGYYGRWDRFTGRDVSPSQPERPKPETRPTDTVGRYDGSRGTKAVQDAVAASRAKRDDDAFQALVSANFETVELGDDETHLRDISSTPAGTPPILGCMLAVFRGRGNPEALPTKILIQDLPGELTAKALGRLMGLCSISPTENIVWDGTRHRGYTRDAVETSVKRGSWTNGAADWQP